MRITPIRLKRLNNELEVDSAIKSLNISKSMLYKIETGHRLPSPKVIAKMSKLYNCSIDEIYKALKIS